MAQRKAKAAKAAVGAPGEGMTGFAVLDNKGHLSLSKPVRQALGMRPGSTLAYVVVNGGLLLIPQDEHWRLCSTTRRVCSKGPGRPRKTCSMNSRPRAPRS